MRRASYGTTARVLAQAAIPSIGFSGAGFLTTYHLGVSKCLKEHGYLNFEPKSNIHHHHRIRLVDDDDDEGGQPSPPLLTGVSGGAITIASIAAGVDPEIGMITALNASKKTRQAGFLDAFQPGFSLLDQVELPILKDITDAVGGDTELLLRRIRGGKILRIGLTDRSVTPFISNPKAYVYCDQYRDAEDVVAACMLSSFVAGVTGPYYYNYNDSDGPSSSSSSSSSSPTITRATSRIREMMDLGFIKKQQKKQNHRSCSSSSRRRSGIDDGGGGGSGGEITNAVVSLGLAKIAASPDDNDNDNLKKTKDGNTFPRFVDGGLSNGYPIYDEKTLLVTPLRGKFDPNRFICPRASSSSSDNNNNNNRSGDDDDDDDKNLIKISNRVRLYMNGQNALTLRRMILSSEDSDLQWRYSQGYDDAERFLDHNNLLTVHRG